MSARIPVAGMLAGGQGQLNVLVSAKLDLHEVNGSSILMLEPLQGEVQVRKEGRLIVVTGTLRTKVELACGRCLEPVTVPLSVDYREAFYREGEWELVKSTAETLGFSGGDEVHPFKGDTIDLSQSLTASLMLNLPMKVLCREDCRGLCPMCGTNLNRGNCDCSHEELDPRLATLRQLLGRELES
ncbi:MAG: DUF177 domain-containing protein [Clostridia bacterium]|nr:DUF177 domain-containing protein [Clostridia bacterium]